MFFSDLTPDEVKQVETIGQIQEFQKDDHIIVEGEQGNGLFLIKKGKVQVRKKLEDDKFICLMELAAGDMFGEMSFLALEARSASVVAIESCTVMSIDRSDFQSLVEKNPVIGTKVYRAMAKDLATRLNRNTEELRRAILWAMEEMHGLDRIVRP